MELEKVAGARAHMLGKVGNAPVIITQKAIQSVPRVESEAFPKDAKILQEMHRGLLEAVSAHPLDTEMLRCYDKGWKLLSEAVGAGGKVDGASGGSVIAIHNHPDGNTFSQNDLRFFLSRGKIQLLSAVGNDGSVYLLEKTAAYDGMTFYNRYFVWEKQIDLNTITAEDYIKSMETMLKGAEQDGVRYVKRAPEGS